MIKTNKPPCTESEGGPVLVEPTLDHNKVILQAAMMRAARTDGVFVAPTPQEFSERITIAHAIDTMKVGLSSPTATNSNFVDFNYAPPKPKTGKEKLAHERKKSKDYFNSFRRK